MYVCRLVNLGFSMLVVDWIGDGSSNPIEY